MTQTTTLSRSKRSAIALLYGIVNHGTFLVAVSFMAAGLATGMRTGLGRLDGAVGWFANALLALQFPLLHTWLLSRAGRRLVARLAPGGLGRDLATTTFAWLASLQVLVTFALWSPSGTTWGTPHGLAAGAAWTLFGASWLLLGKAMLDAGLGLQTGSLGWTAVLRGRAPRFGPFPVDGLFKRWRQPVYTSFAAILVTGPTWSPDRAMLLAVWGAYCLVGPVFKERRFERMHGPAFAEYQARTPYWLPRLRTSTR